MTTFTIREAAAATAVGTNLMAGHREQSKGRFRYVRRIGVVGSTAAGDASIDLFYGSTYIGTFFNTTGGANLIPLDSRDMIIVAPGKVLEPNEFLNVFVSDASLANVLAITLEVVEL